MSVYTKESYRSNVPLLDEYLSYIEVNGSGKSTVKTYGQLAMRFQDYLSTVHSIPFTKETIGQITPLMLVEYYHSLFQSGLSVNTRNLYVNMLRSLFGYLKDVGYVTGDPCAPLKIKAIKREKYEAPPDEQGTMFTVDEAIKLLSFKSKHNGLRNRAIIALILGTGLRAFEVTELTIGTIRNMKNGMMYCHRKGDIWRYVPVPQATLDYIAEYLELRGGIDQLKDADPLFTSTRGGFMDVRSMQHSINEIQKKLGMKTGLHMIRHTAITGVQKSGGVAVARDVASHANVDVTNKYLHSTAEERVKAAADLPWFNPVKA